MTAVYDKPPTETGEQPIQQVLAQVMREVRSVGKEGHNTQQGYSFRGIDGVLNALGPAMRKYGVIPTPELLDMESALVEVGIKRTLMRSVTVKVRYTFTGPAGDTRDAIVPGEAMDSGDKAISKAMSVAYRTALIQVFALPTEDRDPDEDSYERAAARPAVVIDWAANVEALSGNVDGLLMLHRIAKAHDADEATLAEIVEAGKAARAAAAPFAPLPPAEDGEVLCEGSGDGPSSGFRIEARGGKSYGMCGSCLAYVPLDGGTVLTNHARQDNQRNQGVNS